MSQRDLPAIPIPLNGGINTQIQPESASGRFLRSCQNMDYDEEFRTLSVIPGSTRVSNDHGAAVKSLHQFEYTDLAGVRQREQLSVANTNLYRIESDKSITSLTAGLTIAEPLCDATMLDRIHLSGPGQLGLPTGGIKYDGANVRNWGVQAPGATETKLVEMDDNTEWTASADATLDDETSNTRDGVGAIVIDKDGTTTTKGTMSRTDLSEDWSALGQDTLFEWFFVPAGGLSSLNYIEIRLGDDASNYDEHQFDVGELAEGWNILGMVLASPDTTGGSGATLASVNYLSTGVVLNNTSDTQLGFLAGHFYAGDDGTISAATGSAGNPSGTYTYRCSYLTEKGVQSNLGPVSASVSPSSEQVDLSSIPISPDAQVIARRIYRDIGGDAIYRFVGQIDDNTTTTFTDDLADASLGAADAPIAGSDIDASPPGRLVDAIVFERRIIGIDADNRFTLKPSAVNGPEEFAILDEIQLEEELVAIENHALGALVYSTDKIFLMSGDGVDIPFRVDEVTSQSGTNVFRTVAKTKGINVTVREAEVFLISNPGDPWFLNGPILDQFRALSAAQLAAMHIQHYRRRYSVVFFTGGDTFFVYQYATQAAQQITGDGAGVDPQDLRVGVWVTGALPASIDPQSSMIAERTADLPELWIGGNDGYVYLMYDDSTTTWAENTGTAAMAKSFETWDVPTGSGVGGRSEPRYIKVNGEASAETAWTFLIIALSDLDGAIASAGLGAVTLGSGNTSPITSLPRLAARGSAVRFSFSNSGAAGVGSFRSLVLYHIPRGDFRGVRAS